MAKANTKKTTPTVNHPTTPEEKKKALDTAMEQIIKNYGQGAVMFLGGEGNKKLDVEDYYFPEQKNSRQAVLEQQYDVKCEYKG